VLSSKAFDHNAKYTPPTPTRRNWRVESRRRPTGGVILFATSSRLPTGAFTPPTRLNSTVASLRRRILGFTLCGRPSNWGQLKMQDMESAQVHDLEMTDGQNRWARRCIDALCYRLVLPFSTPEIWSVTFRS